MIESSSRIDRPTSVLQGESRAGYSTARAAELRARSTRYGEEGATRSALDRLSRLLDQSVPLRRDVPPGYYLNIQV